MQNNRKLVVVIDLCCSRDRCSSTTRLPNIMAIFNRYNADESVYNTGVNLLLYSRRRCSSTRAKSDSLSIINRFVVGLFLKENFDAYRCNMKK